MTAIQPRTRRALIIVDVQNDFCEGGSLAVTGGREVARKITEHLRAHGGTYDLVVATRDFHTAGCDNGGHFAAEGTEPDYTDTWPVHCVADTNGAEYAPELDTSRIDVHVKKGMDEAAYSGFEGYADDGRDLIRILAQAGIHDVDVCGLATDYCVKATALDALSHAFGVRLLPGLHAGVAPETFHAALGEMAGRGVEVNEGVFAP